MRYQFLIILFFSFFHESTAQDAILGKWANSAGEAHVSIFKRQDKFYGKIIWIKDPKGTEGIVKTDLKNPDASLRNRPLLGLEILKDFVYQNGKWVNGKVYDPKSGKTYDCNMYVKDGAMNMRGYIGFSLIGRTEVWKRVK